MRAQLPAAVALALAACNPPIVENETPGLDITSPTDGAQLNEGSNPSLVATVNDRDEQPLTITVVSDKDGEVGSAESEANVEVTVPLTLTTFGAHVLEVTLSDGIEDVVDTVNITYNGAPSLPGLEVAPTDPDTTMDVVATRTTPSVDPEGKALIYTFDWQLQGDVDHVSDATLPAADTQKGDIWTVSLAATETTDGTNPDENAITVVATMDVTIGNAPPSGIVTATVLPAVPSPLDDLECRASGAADPDGDPVTYEIVWKQNNVATAFTGRYLSNTAIAPNDRWSCEATATDGEDVGPFGVSGQVIVGPKAQSASTASVRVSGDANNQFLGRYAVGAPLDDVEGDDLVVGVPDYKLTSETNPSGMVAVFRGLSLVDGTIDTRNYSLRGATDAALGGPEALAGDVDGDGGDDLIVAQHPIASAPTVFVLFSDTITTAVPVYPFNGVLLQSATSAAGFGAGLAGGDPDGDGAADVFVGETAAGSAGVVRWFAADDLVNAGPDADCQDPSNACLSSNDAKGPITGGVPDDGFGTVIAADGDIDGDGTSDVLITAPGTSVGQFAWLFSGTDVAAGLPMQLVDASIAFSTSAADGSGAAAALADVDGDGYADMFLSAPHHDGGVSDAGLVAMFAGGTALPTSLGYGAADVSIEGRQAGGAFGAAIGTPGDLGHDGLPDLTVDAPLEDVSALADAGVVYVFTGQALADAVGTTFDADGASFELHGETADDRLQPGGFAGDLDGDGQNDLVVSSPTFGPNNQGRFYVFLSGE
jgi:hypothetical protein